jgi:hypothetical protein
MSEEEAETFAKLTPIIGCSITTEEAEHIARLLGYESWQTLSQFGFNKNPFLKNAYIALSFLHLSKLDSVVFNDFWNRLVFTDKNVEERTKKAFHIQADEDTLTSEDLEELFQLETDIDEWKNT